MKFDTIKDATISWVESFNAIPMSVIEKVNEYDIMQNGVDSIVEITPPAIGDRVYINSNECDFAGQEGEIVGSKYDGEDDLYEVKLDSDPDDPAIISADCIEVLRYNPFPMWGTMWQFSDPTDVEWANGEYLGPHLQEIADCGFRIYESEDFGILLGINGAGYDFYESHWIPLYKTRGLHWHKEEENVVGTL